ncbi:MAG: polymer-forming cytoskeletal protein [bacterium]
MSKGHSEGNLDTAIGPETAITGDLQVKASLRMDGRIDGKIEVSDTVLAGPKSHIKGEIRCREAVIAGTVEGNIVATETVELQSGARVHGNITCKGLIIQRDSFFEGNCAMSARPGETAPGSARPAQPQGMA